VHKVGILRERVRLLDELEKAYRRLRIPLSFYWNPAPRIPAESFRNWSG
jgi:hypothetical protein